MLSSGASLHVIDVIVKQSIDIGGKIHNGAIHTVYEISIET